MIGNLTEADQAEWQERHDNILRWARTWLILMTASLGTALYVVITSDAKYWAWAYIAGYGISAAAHMACERRHALLHYEVEDE